MKWKKDWPYITLAVLAVGWFFLHRPPPPPTAQPRQVRGRGHFANRGTGTGLYDNGGMVA